MSTASQDPVVLRSPTSMRFDDSQTIGTPESTSYLVPVTTNEFPDWLLQMLGPNFNGDDDDPHDEPHFYCQGDGLGVHPSIIAVEVDDDEEASSESSSSTNGSANLAETGIEGSEQDGVSLPEDTSDIEAARSSTSNDISLSDIIISSIMPQLQASTHNPVTNDESDEYFDTTDEIDTSVPTNVTIQ